MFIVNFNDVIVEIDESYEWDIYKEFDTLPYKSKIPPRGWRSSNKDKIWTSPNKLGLRYCSYCLNILNWTDVGTNNSDIFTSWKINTDETKNECLYGCPYENPCYCDKKITEQYFKIRTEINKHFKFYSDFNDDCAKYNNPFYYSNIVYYDDYDYVFAWEDERIMWLDRELVLEKYILNLKDNKHRSKNYFFHNDIQKVLQYDQIPEKTLDRYYFSININDLRI